MKTRAGFEEVEHTADWALRVWAPDLPELLRQAAAGMLRLMGVRIDPAGGEMRRFSIEAPDAEGLLVSFLTELVLLCDEDRLAFDGFRIAIEGPLLTAEAHGGAIREQTKEIKAVTYHNLSVVETARGLEATIVFDV